jgi:hypothetical protein
MVDTTLILTLNTHKDLMPMIFRKLADHVGNEGTLILEDSSYSTSIYAEGEWGKREEWFLCGYAHAWFDILVKK